MPINERLTYLLEQAKQQKATTAEYRELLDLILLDDTGDTVSQIDAYHAYPQPDALYDRAYWQDAVTEILQADKPRRVYFMQRKWWAAASVLLLSIALLATGAYHWFQRFPRPAVVSAPAPDVAPGGNKAILTLADGSRITLDSAGNGTLAQQGNVNVVKLSNGQLAYRASGAEGNQVLYNTMSTPRGGQYRLILPDGTEVWLNAGSSITYPTAFTGRERSVSITGEAYFEVARNEQLPFKVKVPAQDMEIEVLGTHFNINAYKDEASVNTTLLEGAVRINARQQQQVLQPGQEARVKPGESYIQLVNNANLEQAIAWKEGYFSFNNVDLPAVMRQLARWYDVEVEYEGKVPERTFSGEIGRGLTLAQVLKGLTSARVKYRIDGRRITIEQ